MKATNLQCEYLTDPMGIDVIEPRLSWQISSDERGQGQTAYHLLVASSTDKLNRDQGDLWDSGKVPSEDSLNIVYAGQPLAKGMVCHWKVRVWDRDGNPTEWSEAAVWSLGTLSNEDWKAEWIGVEAPPAPTNDPLPAQMLRKEFALEGPIQKATLYASALGVYELRLNGERVGDHLLAPEWTNYDKRVQYQTYDVTSLLKPGDNALGAHLGDGWYAGRIGLANVVPEGPVRGIYGPRPRLLAQLEVTDSEGKVHLVGTDSSWQATTEGPIRISDTLDGEVYDARREMPGWDLPAFEPGEAWKPVVVMDDYPGKIEAQMNEPIRVIEEIRPIEVTEPKPGEYVFDLGQNMVGWCEIRVEGKPGQEIRLRHAEVLNPDGTIYRDNLRMPADGGPWGARQEDRYTCRGEGVETFEPRFTFHGFRYVEVVGLEEKPGLDFLTGKVFYSAAPATGKFECSSPMLNQLMHNIVWTQRANQLGVPTDCPQRDERLGWMGDALVFAPAACFNMQMAAFYEKWVQDIRDAQAQDGRFPDVAPHPFDPNARFSGVAAWGDAGVVVPWVVYQFYNDKRLLEEHYESARAWIDHIDEKNPDHLWKNSRGNDYGDWLNADTFVKEGWPKQGGEVPKEIFATLCFAHSTDLLAQMAAVIGNQAEAEKYSALFADIKSAFNQAYVTPDGKIRGDTQAGYALALAYDVLPSELEPMAVEHLLAALDKYDGHISTGFVSTIRLMKELTKTGHNDIAYQLINHTTFPSWGYTIEQGATTIWERWDGYVEGRGFQDPGMNSFSHYAIGSVGEWMYRTLLGINPDPASPGFKHILLRPQPGGGLTWAKGSYDSIRGPIAVDWKQAAPGEFALDVSIPAGTTATLYLPAAPGASITEGGKALKQAVGVELAGTEEGATVVKLGSGTYSFAAKPGE